MKVSDFYEEPFTDLGIGEDDFKHIEDILNKPIRILAAKLYTKDGDAGAFVAFMTPEGDKGYFATHAKNLVGFLKNDRVVDALADGEVIDTQIVKRKSTTSDRLVYAFV